MKPHNYYFTPRSGKMSEKDEVKYAMDKAVKLLGYTELKREQELATI